MNLLLDPTRSEPEDWWRSRRGGGGGGGGFFQPSPLQTLTGGPRAESRPHRSEQELDDLVAKALVYHPPPPSLNAGEPLPPEYGFRQPSPYLSGKMEMT